MPSEESADDRAEAQRLLAEARLRRALLPLSQEDRLLFWDRLRTPVRKDEEVEALAQDLAWVRRGRLRSAAMGKRIMGWITFVFALGGFLFEAIKTYVDLRVK